MPLVALHALLEFDNFKGESAFKTHGWNGFPQQAPGTPFQGLLPQILFDVNAWYHNNALVELPFAPLRKLLHVGLLSGRLPESVGIGPASLPERAVSAKSSTVKSGAQSNDGGSEAPHEAPGVQAVAAGSSGSLSDSEESGSDDVTIEDVEHGNGPDERPLAPKSSAASGAAGSG